MLPLTTFFYAGYYGLPVYTIQEPFHLYFVTLMPVNWFLLLPLIRKILTVQGMLVTKAFQHTMHA